MSSIRAPPLQLKAKKPFPPYDEGCKKVDLSIKKKEEKKTMDKFRSSWKKFATDIQTPSSLVKASGATINGYPINGSQVTFLADEFDVRIRDNTHYWYDKESGFFGKMGGICQRHIDPRLKILGDLDPRSSVGDTRIFVNGREITSEEKKNWKRSGMVLGKQNENTNDAQQLPSDTASYRYTVDPLGNVFEDASKTLLFNWRQKYRDMQNKQIAMGVTVVGVALLGGMVSGGEGLMFGGGGEESILGGGGGGDFYASDVTGATSNFASSGAGYISFDDGSSVSIGL